MTDPVAMARLERARSRKVMLCIPTARAPVLEFTIAFSETCMHLMQSGIPHCTQFVVGSSNLPRARNELVARFLASDCTDMIFIDDDMGWDPLAILRLVASDKSVIAGVGRKRVDKPNSDPNVWCVHLESSAEHAIVQDAMGAVEVKAVGTAFMKIERSVFEKMIVAHPEWKRDGHDGMSEAVKANYYQFFRFDPDDTMELGEDFVFCKRWRDIGGSIWIDPTIWLAHVGSKAYSGRFADELMVARGRTLEAAE
jgi:hypothetical protein